MALEKSPPTCFIMRFKLGLKRGGRRRRDATGLRGKSETVGWNRYWNIGFGKDGGRGILVVSGAPQVVRGRREKKRKIKSGKMNCRPRPHYASRKEEPREREGGGWDRQRGKII